MRHYIYSMVGDRRAPAGDGDTKSWFLYYKWRTEGETSLPMQPPLPDVVPGDLVWCVLDGSVLGAVEVLRVEEPERPFQRQELWYDADKVRDLPDGRFFIGQGTSPEEWLEASICRAGSLG